jgi:hypothetical protein
VLEGVRAPLAAEPAAAHEGDRVAPHGLDVTKTILGHAKVETSLVYAEKDLRAAMDLVARIG